MLRCSLPGIVARLAKSLGIRWLSIIVRARSVCVIHLKDHLFVLSLSHHSIVRRCSIGGRKSDAFVSGA